MLNSKIQYLLDNRDEYITKAVSMFEQTLEVYGQADFKSPVYLDMLFSGLSLDFLGHNLRLELYKRIIEMLRKLGINHRIPEPEVLGSNYSTIFYGSGDTGLVPGDIVNLTETKLNLEEEAILIFNPTMEVMYFAFPDTQHTLSKIIDSNGFNVSAGWILRTETLIVEGSPVVYKVYESKNLTTLSNFDITFKF